VTAHSKTVGSSNAGRVIACPHSAHLSEGMPNKSSDYADEGSMLHAAMEAIMRDEVENEADVIGMETEWGTVTKALYEEMIVPALNMFDETFSEDLNFMVEQTVHLPPDVVPESFGTADILGYDDEYNAICDWKFGRGIQVFAKDNKQLLFIASAARFTHPEMIQEGLPFKGAIIQPGIDPDEAQVWEFTHEDVDQFENDLEDAWNIRHQASALSDGEHCTFCPAKARCPVKINKVKRVQQLRKKADAAPGTNEFVEGTDLAELLPLAEEMEAWAKAVKKTAHEELERGIPIPGYKLVAKRAQRKWTDEGEAEKFLKGCRFSKEEIFPPVLISAPQAEKLLFPADLSKRAKTIRTKKFEALVEAKSSGTTLAPEDDKRPAVGDTKTKLDKIRGIENE